MRDAFIRSVMNDVPNVDYAEKLRAAVVAAAVAKMPPAVAKLWKDKNTCNWISTVVITVGGVSAAVPSSSHLYGEVEKLAAELSRECADLVSKIKAQRESRETLRRKLKAAAYAYSTRKSLAAALPEFEKYLPADEAEACKTLPAIANVVTDFVQAGWPKGDKK
jgi:hypothetical protein